MTSETPAVPSTGYLVWHLSLRWQVQLSRALAPVGITHTEYGFLASLHGLSASGVRPSQRELADVSGLEPMYVSKLARSLEADGLVERGRHPDDPRAVQLSLTERGIEVVRQARAIVRRLDAARLEPLGGPESERAAELRDALVTLLRHTSGPGAEPPAVEADAGPGVSRRRQRARGRPD